MTEEVEDWHGQATTVAVGVTVSPVPPGIQRYVGWWAAGAKLSYNGFADTKWFNLDEGSGYFWPEEMRSR